MCVALRSALAARLHEGCRRCSEQPSELLQCDIWSLAAQFTGGMSMQIASWQENLTPLDPSERRVHESSVDSSRAAAYLAQLSKKNGNPP